jgi:hypothetical protein
MVVMPVIQVLRRLRSEDHKFEPGLQNKNLSITTIIIINFDKYI